LGRNLHVLIPSFSNLDHYPFWAGFSILFLIGWVCILAATLLTRPEPMEILQNFYLTAKPIGFWGPVRRSLGIDAVEAEHTNLLHDLKACALGILFYFLLTTSLFSLMGGHLTQGIVALIGAVVSGMMFAKTAISRLKVIGIVAPVKAGD